MRGIPNRFRTTLFALTLAATVLSVLFSAGCYMYQDRSKVLLAGIDMDQSLDVAAAELAENRFGTVLGVWALRDQKLNAYQAERVSRMYFQHIDRIDSDAQKNRGFSVWHLTWAIADMYRLGNADVKWALQLAYEDAGRRVQALDRNIAHKMYDGDRMYLGDAHFGGRAYAQKHLVVPGNPDYLQSKEEYFAAD